MAMKSREEFVGKRFLSVRSDGKLKVSKISEWEWRSGFVRAVSTRDSSSADFTVLVEFDDTGWKSREYLKVHQAFQVFLVEHSLAWVDRTEPTIAPHTGQWPALSFKPVVDKADLFQQNKRPVEFLSDRLVSIVDEKDIDLYKEGDETRVATVLLSPEVKKWVKKWTDYQDGQKILLTTPTVLLGYRVEVYRTEGTTQWYTAVIKAYNHTNKSLTLTDDTVLEEHNEDPTLIQMHLIGDGVVESILNGEDVGVAQRRRPRSTVIKQNSKDNLATSASSRNSQTTTTSSGKNSSANTRSANSPATTTSATSSISVTSHSSSSSSTTLSSSTTTTTSNSSATTTKPVGSLKGRSSSSGVVSSVSTGSPATTDSNHSPLSTTSTTPSKDTAATNKGHNQRPQKVGQKRKSDRTETPSKTPAKKSTASSKNLRKANNPESLEEQTTPAVCNQTCNVIVERIEEEDKKKSGQPRGGDGSKGKPPRLREESRKSSDSQSTVVNSDLDDESPPSVSTKSSPDVKETSGRKTESKESSLDQEPPVDKKEDKSAGVVATSKSPPAPGDKGDQHGKRKERESRTSRTVTESTTRKKQTAEKTSSLVEDKVDTPPSLLSSESRVDDRKKPVDNNDLSSNTKSSKQPKLSKKKENIQQNWSETPSVSSEDKGDDDDSMHYKKQMLRAGGPSPNSAIPTISEGINVNISLTDQITKRNKGNLPVNGDGKPTGLSEMTESRSPATSISTGHHNHPHHSYHPKDSAPILSRFPPEANVSGGDRQSAFSSVQRGGLSVVEDRGDSWHSESQPLSLRHEEKRPGSRLEDVRCVGSSPASSPLEMVNPYRDPELMRKNTVQSNVPASLMTSQQQQQQQQQQPQGFPHPSTSLPPHTQPSGPPVAFPPGVPGLPARSLLASLPPYSSSHPLPPSMSHPLSLPHGYPVDAALVRAQHQQLLLQQQQQQQQLLAAGFPATHMATLEALWQRKLPPNPWGLAKNPEAAALLAAGDYASSLQREHLLQLEQERREHDRREAADRLEQERRDKERKEQIERERAEKAEREKQEQERRERERLERERERMEKERRERERKEWEEHKQNQERILRAAEVDTVAAVDQHFAASLTKLANQQGLATMFPLGRGGRPGSSFVPKTEPSPHLPLQSHLPPMAYHRHHPLPHHHHHHHQDSAGHHFGDPHKDDIKREVDIVSKASVNEKPPVFPHYQTSGGYTAGVGAPHGQKPVFNLYGFPSSPSTISTEQLKQRGLLPDSRTSCVKEELLDKKPGSFSPHLMAGYPKADPIKREPHNSVIVKRDSKMKMEVPMAAHSHHNSPSSSSSSPRLQHPRPAHTPEHRPDRPLSSSASPASSSLHHGGHLIHHSNTAGGATGPVNHSHMSPRSQSPYTPAHTMPQPLDYCKSSMANKSSRPADSPSHCSYQTTHHASPVSLASVAYNNSLIQQGLVPNPIYSHPSTQHHPQHQSNPPTDPPITRPSPNALLGSRPSSQASPTAPTTKRKPGSNKDVYNHVQQQKRPKSQTVDMVHPPINHHHRHHPTTNPSSLSIPVTTPQILSNPSPYTTTNSSVFQQPSSAASTTTAISSSSSVYPTVSSSSSSSVTTHPPAIKTGFSEFDFRSFVENTVQEAFQQTEKKEAERNRTSTKLKGTSSGPVETRPLPPSTNSSGGVSVNLMDYRKEENVPPPSLPAFSVSSDSYNSRIMETINRVANNQMDTDSDTLSASSPPPQIKPSETSSPLNKGGSNNSSGSSHPHHMKKAWLQRHDEDKKSETPVFSTTMGEEDSNSSLSQTKDIISCVENSSISRCGGAGGQESTSVSPANVVVTLPNGNISDLNNHHDESTSSASEAETQSPSKVFGSKKRVKQRKSGTGGASGNKKVKADTEAGALTPTVTPPPSASTTPTNAVNSNSRKKNTSSNRRSKQDKETKIKDEASSRKNEVPSSASTPSPEESTPTPTPEPCREEKSGGKGPTPTPTPVTGSTHSSPPSPPHSERSNASPALSESNTVSSVSSTSSSSSTAATSTSAAVAASKVFTTSSKENKDKKKAATRKGKDGASGKKSSSFNKPLVKQSVQTLKRTMAHFIQDGSCSEVTPKLTKCRECKMTPVQRSKKQPNIFCRFYAFRRLRYNPRGIVKIEGFSQLSDADPDDIEPWLPQYPIQDPYLDIENAKFILAKVGDKFCELVEQEREAKTWAQQTGADSSQEVSIVWKRAVMGVREMCDVCDTTLFNMHWVCHKCGFVVCLDCYKARVEEGKEHLSEDRWLTCSSNRQAHDVTEMMLTQIIPSDALWELGRLIHDIRIKWSIPSNCSCPENNLENSAKSVPKNGINQQLLHAVTNHSLPNGLGGGDGHGADQLVAKSKKHSVEAFDSYHPATTSSPLSILAEVAYMDSESNRDMADGKRKASAKSGGGVGGGGEELLEEADKKGCSTLRELLTKTARKIKAPNDKKSKKGSGTSTLDDIIQSVVEKSCLDGGTPFKFLHYTPRMGGWKREMPIICHNLTETSILYPDVPHSWLCDGRLLRLHDGHHKGNLQIFQEQWKRGQPVLVSCSNKKMNLTLWKPEVFSKEFGHIENEVVNCRTGDVIIGHTMSDFWDGFQSLEKRPADDQNEPMLLKLKDWPPGDDFSELLPSRFHDLMQALPLPEYTHRQGKLNLASRLPDFLVRPDLGPKMYNAYGSSSFPKEGTTNLHLDISDAVNVMVYVGIPGETPAERKLQEDAAIKAIGDADCDGITKNRVREVHEIPGALWHIYDAHDADKMRDFLNKVAKERGEIIETDHDAIHDQSWYLDKELCDRLYNEYGVQGYTIVQCHGDAIFIPAGAPHQVRNLHSCVKVAEDFVSPEHLNHCFRLTQEFRQLSDTHSNHEDKLQVKNIVYHAVKDAVAVLREQDPKDE